MTSVNPAINALHASFCRATGQALPLNMTFERSWHEALKMGVTPEDVTLCVKSRINFNARNGLKKSLALFRLIGTEEGVATLLSEAYEERARTRVKVMDKGRASVLRATGRSDEIVKADGSKVNMPTIMDALRKAVNERL